MRNFLELLKSKLVHPRPTTKLAAAQPEQLQVVVPDAVVLPLPKAPREEMSVPASINGRDLSTGRL